MSKRAKRTSVASDDTTNDVANIGDDGNSDGAVSSTGGGPAPIDPVTAEPSGDTAEPSPNQPKRGRGRPPGSGTGTAKTKPIPLNVSGLEKLLVGIHGGLAILSGRHEWSLDTESRMFDGKTEAEFLAQSTADVARHYGGIADQKTLDWMNLLQCLAIVYGGRLYAIRANPRVKAAPKPNLAVRPGPPPQHHTAPPVNSFDPARMNGGDDMGTGEIAGIGHVEFPDGHPLKPKLN